MSRISCSTEGTVEHTTIPVTGAPPGARYWASSPCTTTARSSAVRRASVAIRQCSTSSVPAKSPTTVWVLPISKASSIASAPDPQIATDVEQRRRGREGTHGQIVHPGLGDGPGRGQPQATAGLEPGPAGHPQDRLSQL